ncbi:MAG: DUF2284 domain-containing protein [Eubacteriales bacterium]|nr:DUF2284 domain-containing protein [Eubacteriales bacterium]
MNDLTIKDLIAEAQKIGFTTVTQMNPATIELLDEVRDMCSANTCGMYGKNWSCPPACGELSFCREKIRQYSDGILVQTVGDVEDSWDFEAMMEIEAMHKAHFSELIEALAPEVSDKPECNDKPSMENRAILVLGAGACTICRECTYPEKPCRFPNKRISSLEAYGIVVSELCRRNGVGYYYGSQKMAYTSCVLMK